MTVSVRIIKSNDCLICAGYIPRLQKQGYEFEIYDGEDPVNDAQLDEWKIDIFPVVQIISRDTNDKVTVEHQFAPGKTFGPKLIDAMKSQVEKRLSKRG